MPNFSRRRWMHTLAAAAGSGSVCGWLPALADEVASDPARKRHCILLWMPGGPSQIDTFDLKPGHANGGEFRPIATNVTGLQISETLPKLARMADKLAVVRSVSTKEGDHGRGTYLLRTGHQETGPVRHPTIGASLSKQLATPEETLPSFVSISPYRSFNQAAYGPGFLGPKFAPLTVGATDGGVAAADNQAYADLRVDDVRPRVPREQFDRRLSIWRSLQANFLAERQRAAPLAHDTVYGKAVRLLRSDATKVFDLSDEPDAIRTAYGNGRFGQGCLMARRLIERGVPCVEVSLGEFGGDAVGWDTHVNNFASLRRLCEQLDAGWSMLMRELDERGLLERTTILWMGEFGRTPRINENAGRDHFPAAWSCVFGGGGIQGGQVYGATSESGMEVIAGKVNESDVLATLCSALGVSPSTENVSPLGRPIKLAEGTPIGDILG